MPTQVNLGTVRGSDANVNGVSNLRIAGTDGVKVSQLGNQISISAPIYSRHVTDTDNPHNVTAAQIGLGNVANKSESTIIADAKTDIMTSANITSALGYTPVSTTTVAGKQTKLTGESGQIVTFDAQGNAIVVDDITIKPIYGFEIIKDESNPASKIRYIDSNASFNSAYMDFSTGVFMYGDWADAWFIKDLKPRIISSSGAIVEELDPNDYTLKADGTASSIDDDTINGNVMIGIPTVWIKIEDTDETIRVHIANYKVNDDYHAWAHMDSNGNILDYMYISAYNAWDENDSTHKLRSISGKIPTRSQTASNQLNYCRANNTGSATIWDMYALAEHQLITMLCLLIGKSTDSQAIFGNGNMYGRFNKATASVIHAAIPGYPETGLDCDEEGVIPTGTMDTCGLFWGSSANNLGVKVFGIENPWGNVENRIVGLVGDREVLMAKLTRGTYDGSTASDYNFTGDNYIEIGSMTGGSQGYAVELFTTPYGLFPSSNRGGSYTRYYCDMLYISTYYRDVPACVGGYAILEENCGIFTYSWAMSGSAVTIGTRLSLK